MTAPKECSVCGTVNSPNATHCDCGALLTGEAVASRRPVSFPIGMALFFASGAAMLVFELIWFHRWWKGLGVVIALFAPPIAALFPFVYLFKEGVSLLYFGVWAAGLVGLFIAANTTRT